MIVAGDFNCREGSLEYQLLTRFGSLVDSFRVLNPNDFGATMFKDVLVDSAPKRLDYLFYRPHKSWKLTHSEITMKQSDFFYSDHLGVTSTFEWIGTKEIEPPSSLVSSPVTSRIQNSEVTALVRQASETICNGIRAAKKRRKNLLLRAFFITFGVFIANFLSEFLWIFVGIYVSFALIVVFMINDEIAALAQIRKELEFTISDAEQSD